MSTHCYVGTPATEPDRPNLVRARYVHSDGYPSAMIPTLRQLWAGTAARNTTALIDAVLAHDWDYLDPDITDTETSDFAGQYPVAGIGMVIAATTPGNGEVLDEEPLRVFALEQADRLGAEWIYLIDHDTATLTVHTGDGQPVSSHPLPA